MRVLVVGAGGHAHVVADILLRMQDAGADLTVVGYLDDDPTLTGRLILGLPVLGPLDHRKSMDHDAVIVAVGRNRTRQRLAEELTQAGERFVTACHPRAVVAPDVSIGTGTMICAGVVVNSGAVIGQHAILNTGCTVDHHNRIGHYAHIGPGVHLGGDVRVGEGTLVGVGSSVLPQHEVGDWSVIGAGAVVTRDIPSAVTAVGVPARIR